MKIRQAAQVAARLSESQAKQHRPPGPAPSTSAGIPRYRQVYEDLFSAIKSGQFKPGDRLPSEAELGKHYDTSRITVAKAVNELQMHGMVSRRAGSGTHVLAPSTQNGRVFGLLIPDLGRTEIFEPICHGMMQSPLSKPHSLLWGHAMGEAAQQEKEAEHLCQHYISQKVSGVFFAPLEFTPAKDAVNNRIVSALDHAGIQIVLLDRCYSPYPMRSKYDLVGIDNRRAGFLITQHLLEHGVKRVAFIARPLSASTVTARIAGYREALLAHGIKPQQDLVRRGDPDDASFLQKVLKECRPDAIVCANDFTAARVMAGLSGCGIQVPDQMRVVGIDDVKYASLLPVPLTTQHQNCADIGAMAIATMLQRLERPDFPTRDVLLQTHTAVRKSCGSHRHEKHS
ncbi:GntR family transcriptional regulator [Edaphobacter bradus]|uniref:GntR family transcriptional regulator n=1 Tax=Edaphobacter bradus TaxID=2259016 RepID=UPI0021DFAD1B|nr:GntR family transcriptional regulator [Edaphobacter bradus]